MRNLFETLATKDKEYQFRFTAANCVALEQEENTAVLNLLERAGELKILAKLYFCAGKSLNDDFRTIQDVYQMIDDYILEGHTMVELQEKLVDIYYCSGLINDQVYEMAKKGADAQIAELEKLMNA